MAYIRFIIEIPTHISYDEYKDRLNEESDNENEDSQNEKVKMNNILMKITICEI